MKTFIGELIFRFRDDASSKAQQTAKNIGGSMDELERAVKRLNDMPFGGRFTMQLDKLGASASDIERIRHAWEKLQSSIASRGLSKAAAKAEIDNFKLVTLGQLSAIRDAHDQHAKEMENRARSFSQNLQLIMKPALVAMGGYTGAYMVGVGARAGITASSNEQRERARQYAAGLPKEEQDEIERLSQSLAGEYRIVQADAMEIMREARLAMPSAEAAFGLAKEMIQAYKMLGLSFGSDQAIDGLRAFNKALDTINITENPELYKQMLDSYIKAQQITGADMDPEAYRQAIKYARSSGHLWSPDFLQNMLPFLIAESDGSDTGTQLRAMFDTFIGNVTTKKALEEQGRLGVRDKQGKVVDGEAFARDPIAWVNDYIVPAMIKDGVDMDDTVQVAQAVSKLASNRLAKTFLERAIKGREIYERLAGMMDKAVGLEGAGKIDELDPFSAFAGFKASFANLAAAVTPATAIAASLNGLADGINALSQSWRDGDLATRLGIGAAGGVTAAGVGYLGKMAFDLATAGPALKAAAFSLEGAAASLKGAAAADGVDGGIDKGTKGAGKAGVAAALMRWGRGLAAGSGIGFMADVLGDTPGGTMDEKVQNQRQYSNDLRRLLGLEVLPWRNETGSPDDRDERFSINRVRRQAAEDAWQARERRQDDGFAAFHGLTQEAEKTGQQVSDALNITAKPNVDTADLQAALALVEQIKAGLQSIGALASSAAAQAKRKADAEMRRSFSDYGVAP